MPELLQEIIVLHQNDPTFSLTCLSVWDEKAEKESKLLKNVSFIWFKPPFWASFLDSCIRFFLLLFRKNGASISWGLAFHSISFELFVKKTIRKKTFDKLIFENSIFVVRALKNKKLLSRYTGCCYYHAHSVPKSFFGTEKVLSRFDKIICVSKYIARTFSENPRLNLKTNQIAVLYNGIDTSVFRPLATSYIKIRESLGLSRENFVVLFVGRINPQKGISELIEGIKIANDKTIKLLIVGSPFYGAQVKDSFSQKLLIMTKEIKDQVLFTGYVNHKDLPEYYSACDCVVLPSTWEEPGSIAVIESLACGRPLITTISGGTPEYVGQEGAILLDKGSDLPWKIAQSILHLKNSSPEREQLAAKALNRSRELTMQNFYSSFKKIVL